MSRGMQVFGDWVGNMYPIFDAGQACPTCPPYVPEYQDLEYVPKDEKYNKHNRRALDARDIIIGRASFNILGDITLKEDGELIVTATGVTAATRIDYATITYSIFAVILVDGKEIDRQYITFDKNNAFYPTKVRAEEDFIGNAIFKLPKPQVGKRYELLLEGAYNLTIGDSQNQLIGPPMRYIVPLSTQVVQE